jgi:hypothetical protein
MDAHAGVRDNSLASKRAAEMYELYVGGATLQDVGTRHNISRERVRQIFDRYGYRVRSLREVAALRRALEEARTKEILAMYSEVSDAREVARRLCVISCALHSLPIHRWRRRSGASSAVRKGAIAKRTFWIA